MSIAALRSPKGRTALRKRCVECSARPDRSRLAKVVGCKHCGQDFASVAGRQLCDPCLERKRCAPAATRPCAYCAEPFTIPEREAKRGQRTCSKSCARRLRVEPATSALSFANCARCESLFVVRGRGGLCRPCKAAPKPGRQPKPAPQTPIRYADCARCGVLFTVRRSSLASCCSPLCTKRARRHRERAAERAAGKRRGKPTPGVLIEQFTLREIAERDGWRCHLCGKKVPDRPYRARDKDATMDHLVPRSDGGDHTRANVALAHNRCNWERREFGIAQLRLLG